MAGGLEADIFLGSMADEYRGLLNIRYPMEHGIVKDWNDMEKVWQNIYANNQLNCNPEEVLIITIQILNSILKSYIQYLYMKYWKYHFN